jgi:uncharacterized damage-inducible protein DinB
VLPTIQQHTILVAREAGNEFFRFATAVPAERLEWQPESGAGQSILRMAREIALTPLWALSAMGAPDGENNWASLREAWKTVEDCKEAFLTHFARWEQYVLAMPDSKLEETKWLPFNGGRDHTFLELLEYPRWNTTYHLGQIAYIQTLYGDKEMY